MQDKLRILHTVLLGYNRAMSNLVERGDVVLAPVQGHYSQIPIQSGKGCYLTGLDGTTYLDFAAGIAVAATGHCHPKVVEAISNQAKTLIHACQGVVYYEPHIQLAETLGAILGHGLTSAFFTQSGAEAVETALKLAKYITKKHKVIAFKGSFHGRTMGALSVTSSKDKYREGFGPMVEGVTFFPFPYLYRNPWEPDSPLTEETILRDLDTHLEQHHHETAAVIIEPFLGEGGYYPASTSFLKSLRDVCDRYNILLIFDEIQTGIGRTGKWFCFQHHGVVPDIITLAKGLASGMPLGACISTQEHMKKWPTGAHGTTYGGNPVTCAAALATIEVVSDILTQITPVGKAGIDYLKDALKGHKCVGDIRGMGLMIGVEFVSNRQTKEPDSGVTKEILKRCHEQGLILISCGVDDNVLRIMPPLIITEDVFMSGLKHLVEIINDVD